ncbi:hypothetical protein [Limoniibacter endophyticus]|uniref:Tail protein n=1 Tax=Limoniibacter endophyticus TaxID=1565040 RepID=A0A8J3DPG3_9HYPH|nr:hypothetical protein [Limoniibacter endophyticus]GHC73951.1 tail protein [Limoniibacter endophyticus]
MAKVPANRHSKQAKDPVTIDLAAEKPLEDRKPASGMPETTPAKDNEAQPKPAASSASAEASGANSPYPKSTSPASPAPSASSAGEPAASTGTAKSTGATSSSASDSGGGYTVPLASKTGSGKFAGFGAGLAGGIVVLLLASGAYYSGILPERSVPAEATVNQQIEAMNARLAAVEGEGGASSQEVHTLRAEIDQLRAELQALNERPVGEAALPVELGQRLSQIETRLAGVVGGAGDTSQLQARVNELSEKLQTADQSIVDLTQQMNARPDQPQAALVLAASQLRDAVTRGGDISAAVNGFAALSGETPEVDALKARGAVPVPSHDEIVMQAEAAYAAMLAEAQKPAVDAGVVDKLAASARALVSIRPVGPVEGDGVPEVVSRIEAAVNQSDLDTALAEYAKLPANVQAAGQSFADLLVARRDVLTQVQAASAQALRNAGGNE